MFTYHRQETQFFHPNHSGSCKASEADPYHATSGGKCRHLPVFLLPHLLSSLTTTIREADPWDLGGGNRCGRRIFHWKAADHNFTLLTTFVGVGPLDLCLLFEDIFQGHLMYWVSSQLRTMLPESGSRPLPANKPQTRPYLTQNPGMGCPRLPGLHHPEAFTLPVSTEIGKKAWLSAKLQPGRARKKINAT